MATITRLSSAFRSPLHHFRKSALVKPYVKKEQVRNIIPILKNTKLLIKCIISQCLFFTSGSMLDIKTTLASRCESSKRCRTLCIQQW